MDQENKPKSEFPGFSEQPEQFAAESAEAVEGQIIEQEMSPAEQAALEQELEQVEEAQESAVAPVEAINQPAIVAETAVPNALEQASLDHHHKHLVAENKLDSAGDAHQMLNDLLGDNLE